MNKHILHREIKDRLPLTTQLCRYTLSEKENIRLKAALIDYSYSDNDEYDPQILRAESLVIRACPVLADFLSDWNNRTVPTGPLIIDNLPVDSNVTHGPKTPQTASKYKETAVSEGILLGIGSRVGELYGVWQEGQGLVNNLSPTRTDLNSLTGLGSQQALNLHIENAAARRLSTDRAPEGLALIGVSNDPARPPTFVADGRAALTHIDCSTKSILRNSNRFHIAFPKRWHTEGKSITVPTAVIDGPDDCPSFVAAFYGGLIRPQGQDAQDALQRFKNALHRVTIPITIEPGMMVLLDNRYTFHGRAAFDPTFTADGYPRRWLQRVFWTTTLRRFYGWEIRKGRLIEAHSY